MKLKLMDVDGIEVKKSDERESKKEKENRRKLGIYR